VISDIAKKCGYSEIYFLDDSKVSEKVIGKCKDYKKHIDSAVFFVAIGNNIARKKVYDELILNGAEVITLVDPSAVVSEDVIIGKGTVIMPGAVVNVDSDIGNGVIVNTCASVDHDCKVKDFSHISVGAHLCGSVEIGERVWVGAGATVINNINICDDCMVGAGAVVVKNIELIGVYKGVPAK